MYYAIILPGASSFTFGIICAVLLFIIERFPTTGGFSSAMGQVIVFLLLAAIAFICIIIPYLQTIIVLILQHFIKNSRKDNMLPDNLYFINAKEAIRAYEDKFGRFPYHLFETATDPTIIDAVKNAILSNREIPEQEYKP